MRAARRFAVGLRDGGLLDRTARVETQLYGSLGATGHGHGSDRAVLLGLEGEDPETVDTEHAVARVATLRAERSIRLAGTRRIDFDPDADLTLHRRSRLPGHPNGMTFEAFDGATGARSSGRPTTRWAAASSSTRRRPAPTGSSRTPRCCPTRSAPGAELLARCRETGGSIAQVMVANERAWRDRRESCGRHCCTSGTSCRSVSRAAARAPSAPCPAGSRCPGGLPSCASASEPQEAEATRGGAPMRDPLWAMDWVNLYALAVNEENASGGRIVTAPTNGAAGIIPAVLHYYTRFVDRAPTTTASSSFLLTAAAIGILFKLNASISGAEVGCQGEVGSACSMAAGGPVRGARRAARPRSRTRPRSAWSTTSA